MSIDDSPLLLVGMQPRCCRVVWYRRLLAGRQDLHMVVSRLLAGRQYLHMVVSRLLAGRQYLHMLSSCLFMGKVEMDL
jgi:hypothetical protein